MKFLKVLIVCLFITTALSAQSGNTDKKGQIEVNAAATKQVVPDQIFIVVKIKEKQDSRNLVSIDEQEKELIKALEKIGLSAKSLTLVNEQSNYNKSKKQKKEVVKQSNYRLKVSSAVMVGKVFKQLDEVNLKEAYVSKVDHSKRASLQKEVRIMAIKAAKAKATYLLSAIDEEVGKALVVRENSSQKRYSGYGYEDNYSMDLQSYKKGTLNIENITIKASMFVRFQIK